MHARAQVREAPPERPQEGIDARLVVGRGVAALPQPWPQSLAYVAAIVRADLFQSSPCQRRAYSPGSSSQVSQVHARAHGALRNASSVS
jgi:hypothetical protein